MSQSKILIVDDEPIGRQLLEAILHQENYKLEFAEDGMEAFEKASSIIPDLILLDVMMPEIDGYEVCKRLRKQDSTTHIPIILITALDDRDSRIRGLEAGADDYISKPLDRVEIMAKVKTITQLNRYRSASSTESTGEDTKPTEQKQNISQSNDASDGIAKLLLRSISLNQNQLNEISSNYLLLSSNNLFSSFSWSKSIKNKNIILLCSVKDDETSSILMAALFITLINKSIDEAKAISAGKIMNQFAEKISDIKPKLEQFGYDHSHLSVSLCLIDNELEEIQYSGINNSLLVSNEKKLIRYKGNDLDLGQNISDEKFSYQTFDYASNETIFLYSKSIENELKNYSSEALNDSEIGLRFLNASNENLGESQHLFTDFFSGTNLDKFLIVGIKL